MKVEDFKSFLDAQIRSTQKFDLQTDEDKSKLELNNQKEVDSIFESINISDDFIKLGLQEQVYSKLASQIENGTINFTDLINNKSKINTYVDSCEKAIQKTPEYTKALEQYNEIEGLKDTVATVLTVTSIDTMIKNYDELSSKELSSIYENYSSLTRSQKDELSKKRKERIKNGLKNAENSGDDKSIKIWKDIFSEEEEFSQLDQGVEDAKRKGEQNYTLTSDDVKSIKKQAQILGISIKDFFGTTDLEEGQKVDFGRVNEFIGKRFL